MTLTHPKSQDAGGGGRVVSRAAQHVILNDWGLPALINLAPRLYAYGCRTPQAFEAFYALGRKAWNDFVLFVHQQSKDDLNALCASLLFQTLEERFYLVDKQAAREGLKSAAEASGDDAVHTFLLGLRLPLFGLRRSLEAVSITSCGDLNELCMAPALCESAIWEGKKKMLLSRRVTRLQLQIIEDGMFHRYLYVSIWNIDWILVSFWTDFSPSLITSSCNRKSVVIVSTDS